MALPAGILPFLEAARVAHLATATASGEPHVVPVCFALLDAATVVFAIDDKPKAPGRVLKRLRNLEENPRFALVVDRWDENWGKLGYVMLHGTGRICADLARRSTAIAALRSRYPQYRAMKLDAGRHAVVELSVESWHAWGAVE
ncbi:MAG TPA: TIGR03668 family PPOX class F420-dependent oxidoreductase [Candidatus Bathyarchaeia archaeon]|nr:TIGR03668 family PPOX class F420-dependent oxidoreductase [Candidatus Bathyarchaeia archaeon]